VSGRPLRACPCCGGTLRHWRSVPSSEPVLGARRFALLRCQACGSAVTAGEPIPALHDSGAYRPGTPRLHGVALPLLRAFDRRRLALLADVVAPPARLLDLGAGRGRFVAVARAAGYEATGVEPSRRGVTAAAALGIELQQASIEEVAFGEASFDAISAWHVLEHVEDPAAALARITAWLRPGGALLVGVPNLAGAQARLGGERWYHLDVPRHRTHFTQAGLLALVRAAGLRPLRTVHLLLEHNPYGMWQSLVNRLTRHPSYLYNLLKRNAPLDARDLALTIAALPLAPVAATGELVAGLTGRGGTIAMIAVRGGYDGRYGRKRIWWTVRRPR
jgi:SAM-dependent methyltransferase